MSLVSYCHVYLNNIFLQDVGLRRGVPRVGLCVRTCVCLRCVQADRHELQRQGGELRGLFLQVTSIQCIWLGLVIAGCCLWMKLGQFSKQLLQSLSPTNILFLRISQGCSRGKVAGVTCFAGFNQQTYLTRWKNQSY